MSEYLPLTPGYAPAAGAFRRPFATCRTSFVPNMVAVRRALRTVQLHPKRGAHR
jgi:hypothetical protein